MSIRAAQYVRMSTDQQPLSIPTQKVAIAAYAATLNIEIIRTYADQAKSGTTLIGRGGMQQLLHDVTTADCPFTVVLVLDVSRWGRYQDVDESAYYEYHCRKHGVRVMYVAEQFKGSTTPFDALLKQMKRAMAAEYSRELGAKSRAAQVEAVQRGFATGMLPCMGYRRQAVSLSGEPGKILGPKERKPMVTDRIRWVLGPPEEVEVVRRVFRDYADGQTIRSIVHRLKVAQVRSHCGKPITIEMLRGLLGTQVVTGTYSWGTRRSKTRKPKTELAALAVPARNDFMVEAIIDGATWELTQQRLRAAAEMKSSGYRKDYLAKLLREGLARDPNLSWKRFVKNGLPHPLTYAKHFGSVTAAYAAAGRDGVDEPGVHKSAVRIGKRFTSDVFDLLQNADVSASLDRRQNLIHMESAVVKVRVASAFVNRSGEPYWNVGHFQQCAPHGYWLLLLCMNLGRNTGKEFLLIPPGEYATFSGRLSLAKLREFEQYRIADAVALKSKLVAAGQPMGVDVVF